MKITVKIGRVVLRRPRHRNQDQTLSNLSSGILGGAHILTHQTTTFSFPMHGFGMGRRDTRKGIMGRRVRILLMAAGIGRGTRIMKTTT